MENAGFASPSGKLVLIVDDDESVRVALDTENDGNREVLARASEAIQDIVKGKKPKLFRGATTAFQQKIVDFAADNTDGDLELFNRLMEYSQAHDQLVMENMTRKAMKVRAQQGMGLPPPSQPAQPGMAQPEMAQPEEPMQPEQPAEMGALPV